MPIVRNVYYIKFPHTIFSPHSRISIWKTIPRFRCRYHRSGGIPRGTVQNAPPRLGQARLARNEDKYEEMPTQDISHLVRDTQQRPKNNKTKH